MLIVFEGSDGCGKSTQLQMSREWLLQHNIECATCRDPGSTELGERVRSLLLDHDSFEIGNRTEVMLFMAARAQLVEEIIRPAMAAKQYVLCDRFFLSTVVYQGYAGNIPVDEIYQAAELATNGLKPNLTFVFDLPCDLAMQRVGVQRDRMESRDQAFFERVRQGFANEAARFPQTHVLIDASQTIDQVHSQVTRELTRFLHIP